MVQVLNLSNIYRILRNKFSFFIRRFSPNLLKSFIKINAKRFSDPISGSKIKVDLYQYFEFKYLWLSPTWLRSHRRYFSKKARGFGEAPFHAAWLHILKTYKPKFLLEIGVYRGQVISLWQLISDKCGLDVEISGISPLTSEGDEVSKYLDIDYKNDILNNFRKFKLKMPILFKGLSTDGHAIDFMSSKKWDLIYIDGGHNFNVALSDYHNAVSNLNSGGILCIDDSSLYLEIAINGKFKGHPGPSTVVSEYANKELGHLMTVGHNNFFIKR